ncbi:MAG: dihydrodipicolinate synthase family protein [Gammaproteobacteria bacterium]|nr:dihydrodipicolinate synthase family protein [Gammaproteobacteria bacterium]
MFEGINPAMFTPLTDDGDAVSPDRLKKLVPWLLSQGITGLFVCGSTGEGVFLSPEERALVAELTLAEVAGQVPVMVHVCSRGDPGQRKVGKHAAKQGGGGLVDPPFPFELSTQSTFGHWAADRRGDRPADVHLLLPRDDRLHAGR